MNSASKLPLQRYPPADSLMQVMLSTMNLSKSAFGMIVLEGNKFFTSFHCPNPTNSRDVIVRCKMQIRVVLKRVDWRSYSLVFSKRVISKREKTKILVRNHVKLKSLIIRRTEYVDSSYDYYVNMVYFPAVSKLMRRGENSSINVFSIKHFIREIRSRSM